jgi:hypothetical protein
MNDQTVQNAVALLKQAVALLDAPPPVTDPVALKEQAIKLIAARSTDGAGLTAGEAKFGDPGGVISGWRAIKRNDNIDVSAQGTPLGVILFDAPAGDPNLNLPAEYTHDGTTNRQDFTRWLAKQPGGSAEVEFLTSKGWINAVTGEVNVGLAIQDGTPFLVKSGV